MRIGHGYLAAIWGTPWINGDGNFHPITSRPPSSFFPTKVADLIDLITGTWDRDMISNYFWPVDHSRILSTSIGAPSVDDRVIWHYEKDGRFSVRSCYQVILGNMESQAAAGGSSSTGDSDFQWKSIWTLPIPPRIRIFWWRACTGAGLESLGD